MKREKRIGLCALLLFSWALAQPAWAQPEEEEEEPVQARPNPAERTMRPSMSAPLRSADQQNQQAQAAVRSQLGAMGFRIGSMRKLGGNQWEVRIVDWDPTESQPNMRGAISWDPTDRRKRAAGGRLMVEVGQGGSMILQGQGLKAMGLKANAAKLGAKMQVR